MTIPAGERDRRASERAARAQAYFETDLKDQENWYNRRASSHKRRTQMLGFTVMSAGAATSFIQVVSASWVPTVTAALGALVVLVEGWQRIARYDETWSAYRTAAERMKRERRIFINGAGAYRNEQDEDKAFTQFVEAIERIISEEQHIFWQDRRSASNRAEGSAPNP